MRAGIHALSIIAPGKTLVCGVAWAQATLPLTKDLLPPKLVLIQAQIGTPSFLFGLLDETLDQDKGIVLTNSGTSLEIFNVGGLTHVHYIQPTGLTGTFRIHALEDQ